MIRAMQNPLHSPHPPDTVHQSWQTMRTKHPDFIKSYTLHLSLKYRLRLLQGAISKQQRDAREKLAGPTAWHQHEAKYTEVTRNYLC